MCVCVCVCVCVCKRMRERERSKRSKFCDNLIIKQARISYARFKLHTLYIRFELYTYFRIREGTSAKWKSFVMF